MARSRPEFATRPQGADIPWRVPPEYAGPVFIWDLDKTYLHSHIENLWGLLRTALEAPEKKKNISGTVSLLKNLRQDAGNSAGSKAPVFFVSASPPQMRKKIEAKLHLDGVECTHIYFKNQLQHVRRAQFRKLRMHVGYKLIQLLRIRCNLPSGCSYVLFGDDSEDDALTYSLFLDICARNVTGRPLVYLLRDLGLDRQEALTIGRWQRDVPEGNPVKQVYINLITRTEPRYYEKFGPLFTPTRTSIQVAVSEYAYGRLSREGVSAVAYDMHKKYGVSTYTLRKSIEELFSRKAFPDFSFQELWEHLLKQELLDERPAGVVPAPSEELSYFRDPIHAANEHLRIRMKYYEEMT